jgi:hypothetical protein
MGERIYTLCVDFDGVIHGYQSGWKGQDNIPDPPVPGAFEWLQSLIEANKGFVVCIYSSRSKYPSAVDAMKLWFLKHGLRQDLLERLMFPTEKPSAWLTIDDRAICFLGNWPTHDELINFKPWTKLTPDDRWASDATQFPRLLSEIMGVGLTKDQYASLCESMDLSNRDIDDLLDRADVEWEKIKSRPPKVPA